MRWYARIRWDNVGLLLAVLAAIPALALWPRARHEPPAPAPATWARPARIGPSRPPAWARTVAARRVQRRRAAERQATAERRRIAALVAGMCPIDAERGAAGGRGTGPLPVRPGAPPRATGAAQRRDRGAPSATGAAATSTAAREFGVSG
jgi:hypothetical protein